MKLPRWISAHRRLTISIGTAALLTIGITVIAVGVLEVSVLFPKVGPEVGVTTRTCAESLISGTPTVGHECARWDGSGPVNVVLTLVNRDPYHEALAPGKWRPAQGNWLVLQGFTNETPKGCDKGWRDSNRQIELRMSPIVRRHFKFIYLTCSQEDGSIAVFGEAHTDRYDIERCGGDYVIDFDKARDDLIAAYKSRPHVKVIMSQGHPSGATYPSGCGDQVASDGLVAAIQLEE